MRVCVEFDPLTDPLTAGHGRNRETRTDRDRPVSFPLRPSASTRFTLPTVRNQQVSALRPAWTLSTRCGLMSTEGLVQ